MREIIQLCYSPIVTHPDLSLWVWTADSGKQHVGLHICSLCAAVVGSRDTHTAWHNAQAIDGRG